MFAQDPFHVLVALESNQGMMHNHKWKYPWNALELMKIDHKFYLAAIVRNGVKRWFLQNHFQFELKCLKLFMHSIDLETYNSYF